MPPQVSPLGPRRATHRLALIFAGTVVAPGLILSFFGLRALMQERVLADQQIQERLTGVAETTGRRLELELREWQQAATELARTDTTDPTLWPDRVRQATSEPGAGSSCLGGWESRGRFLPSNCSMSCPPFQHSILRNRSHPPWPRRSRSSCATGNMIEPSGCIGSYWNRPAPNSGRPSCIGWPARSKRTTRPKML